MEWERKCDYTRVKVAISIGQTRLCEDTSVLYRSKNDIEHTIGASIIHMIMMIRTDFNNTLRMSRKRGFIHFEQDSETC